MKVVPGKLYRNTNFISIPLRALDQKVQVISHVRPGETVLCLAITTIDGCDMLVALTASGYVGHTHILDDLEEVK